MASRTKAPTEEQVYPTWLGTVVVSLFLVRFLVPTEATDQGVSLWIPCTWMLLGTVAGYMLWREQRPLVVRLGGLDLFTGVFVGGQLVSGLVALAGDCHQRATINYLWEWAGLMLTYVFLRSLVSHWRIRSLFLITIVLLATFLSGLGAWQHYVWYPNQAAKVRDLLQLHESIRSGERLSTSERAEYETLYDEFGASLFSQNEEGRQLLLNRITESTEALGFFALANTLGGVLAGVLILLTALWFQQTDRKHQMLIGLLLAIVTFGLFLTKNLTGWVGALAGLSLLGGRMFLEGRIRGQRIVQSMIALAVVVAVLGVAAFASGGLDVQILEVAPSSLRYRLEYWISTLDMIQEHPWLGVGAGNFREHYFLYKLPGASEEILDPHNLWLDTWANGGLLSLIGLLGVLGVACKSWIKEVQIAQENESSNQIWLPGLLSILVTLAGLFVCGLPITSGLLALPIFWLAITGVMKWFVRDDFAHWKVPGFAYASAFLGIILHLNGAGGIGMPAVISLLFWLVVSSESEPNRMYAMSWTPRWQLACTLFSLACLAGAMWTALVPSVTSENLIQLAHQRSARQGVRMALPVLEEATQADSLSTEAWQQLATAQFAIWESQPNNQQAFQRAINAMDQAIRTNPINPKLYHQRGIWWLKYADRHDSKLEMAEESLSLAVQLYPNSSQIRADYAIALSRAKASHAADEAQRAIELDDLNIQFGHRDKFLESGVRERLENIVLNRDD